MDAKRLSAADRRVLRNISTGCPSQRACAINNHGEVVGSAMTASNQIQASPTKPNQPINPDTDDLGMNSDGNSWAFDAPPMGNGDWP